MKKLFATFAALAMVGLMAVSCKEDNNKPNTGISIKFAPTELSLMEGAISDPIAVTVVPEKRAGELKWFVSDQTIADIDVNTLKVKALKEGTCTITAKLFDANNKAEATADLKVTVAPNVNNQITNVIIKPEKVVLAPQETKDITISILPESAKHGDIVVASTDDKIAKVTNKKDNVFTITANAIGNVTITATVGDKAGKCEVEVKEGGADLKGQISKDFYFWNLMEPFDIDDIKKAEEMIGREYKGDEEKEGIIVHSFDFLKRPTGKDEPFIPFTFHKDFSKTFGTPKFKGHMVQGIMMDYAHNYGPRKELGDKDMDLTLPLDVVQADPNNPKKEADFNDSEKAYALFFAEYFSADMEQSKSGRVQIDAKGTTVLMVQLMPYSQNHWLLVVPFSDQGEKLLGLSLIPQDALQEKSLRKGSEGVPTYRLKEPYEYVLFSNILK